MTKVKVLSSTRFCLSILLLRLFNCCVVTLLFNTSWVNAFTTDYSWTICPFRPGRPLFTLEQNHDGARVENDSLSLNDKALPYAETSRKFRRTYYTHKDWQRHRSEDRFLKNLISTPRSGVVRQLAREVGVVVSISTLVCVWNALIGGFEDFAGQHHEPILTSFPLPALKLPLEPFTLSSPALGLLLVFRTNASYGRWSEARKLWGSVVNHSRNVIRLASSWTVTDPEEVSEAERRDALRTLGMAVWAFPRSLQRHLLGEREDEGAFTRDVTDNLPPRFATSLLESRHRPTRALFELSNAINQLPMTYLRRVEVDKSAIALTDAMGACERIFSSPVPLVYTRHTARFLGGWILGIPLGLYDAFGHTWNHSGLIPACTIIAFFFFGIEELAIQLEEPFSILPLQQLVDGIEVSVREHLDWHFELGSNSDSLSHHASGMNAERIGRSFNSSFLDRDYVAELRSQEAKRKP